MKQFILNVQSKGGAGKSMLTYLMALKHEKDADVFFVDLDSSTQTSTHQLKFLAPAKRLASVGILDTSKRIDREKIFAIFEELNTKKFDTFILDFGAPESQQLPNLFALDFSIEDFKDFEASLGASFIFNVVVSGGPAYMASMNYADEVISAINGTFPVYLYLNEFTFQNYTGLYDEIATYKAANDNKLTGIVRFGNIQPDRNSGQNILDMVKAGKGMADYTGWATKTIIRKEIEKV